MRTVHNLVQGTPEWHEHRRKCDNASDAAAMMNESAYTTRSELLRRRASGVEKEYDAATLARFAKGHELEAQARVWAEEIAGESLYPVTMSDTVDGLLLSASFDGLTMLEDVAWEHKTLNKDLAESLKRGDIPREYFWQMEQGLLISGAEKCLFMASNGTKESMLYAWYYPSADVRKQLLAGWKQFEQDLAAYEHVEVVAAPVAASIEALPALMIQVEGKVLSTNLDQFKEAAQTFIANIKTELVTDQDFADADKMVKFLKDGEERLALCKDQAQSQAKSIDDLFRTIDSISDQMRSKRLALDKLVKAEKENRRSAILSDACDAIAAHVSKLNDRIGGKWMPIELVSAARFSEAIKGLKSIDSMRDKVAGALANAKIEANEIADRIEANNKHCVAQCYRIGDADDTSAIHRVLLPDFAAVCTKATDDFAAMLDSRINRHREQVEAERERIRKEESDRLERLQKENAQATQNALDHSKKAGEVIPPQAVSLSEVMHAAAPADIAQAIAPTVDAAMITEFIALQSCSPAAKKEMRATLERWETYRLKMEAARGMAA